MEYDKKYSERSYPELSDSEPTAPSEDINQSGHDYRIAKITEIQSSLEKEIDKRRNLSKKYGRGVKWVNNVDTILIVTSMGLGAAGVGLLSTVVLAPISELSIVAPNEFGYELSERGDVANPRSFSSCVALSIFHDGR